jgi:hypothetical protein
VIARLGQRSRKPLSLAIVLACGATTIPASLTAQEPQQQQQPAQREHVVRRGDTLWDIARAYFSNPFLWPKIYEANRQVVENPHWIYPEERLVIPGSVQPVVTDIDKPMAVVPTITQNGQEAGRTRFFRPIEAPPAQDTTRPTVLETPDQAPYVVPPREYHSTPFLADSSDLGVLGRVIRLGDPATENDRLPASVRPFDRLYVGRLQGAPSTPGDTVVMVRLGRRIGDAGRIIEPLALLRVDSVTPTVLVTRVVQQFADGRVGDLVMQREVTPPEVRGVATTVSGGAEGQLIAFVDVEPIYATTDRGFVNLGQAHGIALGDELIAYLPERGIAKDRAERLPPTVAGTLRVVKVRGNTATVRVISVENTTLNSGLPVRVVRKVQ